MTTRPQLVSLDRSLLPGLAALALFVVVAAVALGADFGQLIAEFGFPADQSIVGSIGAALIGIDAPIDVENFLVALLVIAVALDAALDGSIMLATRDEAGGEEPAPDGGRERGGER